MHTRFNVGPPLQVLCKSSLTLSPPLPARVRRRRRRRVQLWHDGCRDVRHEQDCESVNVSPQRFAHVQHFQLPRCSGANAECNVVTLCGESPRGAC